MPARLLSIFALFLLLTGVAAQQSADIETYVRGEMQKQRIPGLSFAVVKEGKVIQTAGLGLANVELNVAATPQTVFKIGSVSKQFLATAIMILVQDGKLALSDPVSKYLEGTPETWKDITIRHLLTHTSGLLREAPGFNALKVQKDADVIKTAYGEPLVFPTGKGWQYCNVGYFSLAEIVAKVSGKPWPEFVEERIFKPSGMTASRTTTTSEVVPNRASGYFHQEAVIKNAPEYLALRPSGAFISTVADLAKWDAVLYTDRVLTSATREEMYKPSADTGSKTTEGKVVAYGLGWFVGYVGERRAIYHGGSLPGFRAEMLRLVDEKLTIIVLANADSARTELIARGIASRVLPASSKAAGSR
jgi:CubicO group peptidase (beta-lactamase class C family)